MTARILPFPKERPPRKNPPNPRLIDLLFGNVDLFRLFGSMPDGYDHSTTGRRKPGRQK
ncbi:MAG: hypothetical protein KBD19_02705 [Candidatus Moranbacteria bacterium]|nr:hypothetical protein [Candidatus Moranbacteria bacterium]